MIKVSVLIAAFNEELFIEECLQSALTQSYKNIEVIVINDGSTDGTGALLDAYSKKFENLRVQHQENAGKVRAFNKAFSLATGELITFLGADDILSVNSILERVTKLHATKADIVRGRLRLLTNCNLNGVEVPRSKKNGNRSGGALLFNKKIANFAFPIPPHFPNEDVWLNLIADHLNFKNCVCKEVIYSLRIHENNSFSSVKDYNCFNIRYNERERIIYTFLDRYKDQISKTSRRGLEGRLKIENLRFKGNFKLIFLPGNTRHKLWCVLHINKYTYKLKLFLRQFLFGII